MWGIKTGYGRIKECVVVEVATRMREVTGSNPVGGIACEFCTKNTRLGSGDPPPSKTIFCYLGGGALPDKHPRKMHL